MENYMWLHAVIFYIFAFVLIVSALFVVFSRNPIHSVLFLILAFFNASSLFILDGAEFIGFTLLVVYAGAVAIMFLFVVMFIDIDTHSIKSGLTKALPVALILGIVFLIELIVAFIGWKMPLIHVNADIALTADYTKPNITNLGLLIYTRFFHIFQMGGLVLLVGMLGAISLTLRDKRDDFKTQNICEQNERTIANTIRIVPSTPNRNTDQENSKEQDKQSSSHINPHTNTKTGEK